jgi:hypothetical protein
MKIVGIEWDAANLMHFTSHGRCHQKEVEEILLSRCHPSRVVEQPRQPGDEVRLRVYGQTCRHRYLVVIAAPRPGHVLRPITGWPLSDKELESYQRWRRSLPR